MSLFPKSFDLPQAKFSELVEKKAANLVCAWMESIGSKSHCNAQISKELVSMAVSSKIKAINAASQKTSLPKVFISDADKIVSLEHEAIEIAEALDSTGELEIMAAKIEKELDRRENPEAYC